MKPGTACQLPDMFGRCFGAFLVSFMAAVLVKGVFVDDIMDGISGVWQQLQKNLCAFFWGLCPVDGLAKQPDGTAQLAIAIAN